MPRVSIGNLTGSVTSHDEFLAHFSRAGEVRVAPAIGD